MKIYQNKVLFSFLKPAEMMRLNSNFQALYLPAHAAEIPLLASQVHYYDMSPVFLGGHYWGNETVLQEGVKDLEGSYFATGFYVDSQQGTVKKFADDYLKHYSVRPDLLAAQSYDATWLLLMSMGASMTREDIHTGLLSLRDYDGVSGKTSFGGHGQADKVVPKLKIQNSKYEQVQ